MIIAVSAVSGGGKTTVTQELGKRLDNSVELFFDDYNFEGAPENLIKWVEEGPNYNQWNLEPFLSDIQTLVMSERKPSYLLLDYPFAYQNQSMEKYIDAAIYIDTPLDIAMARRILRDDTEKTPLEIQNDVQFYLNEGRKGYVEMENSIKPDSDLVVDGSLSIDEIADVILQKIKSWERKI